MNRFRGYHLIVDVIQDAGWIWRPVWMANYLIRVMRQSRRGRHVVVRRHGSASACLHTKPDGPHRALSGGGDRRSGRIEGAAEFLLAKVEETPDITLAELQALERARPVGRDRHGVAVLRSMLQKKTAHAAEQERPDVAARRWAWFEANPISIPAGWCSDETPKWPACVAARSVANVAVPRSHMDIGRQPPSPPVYAWMA